MVGADGRTFPGDLWTGASTVPVDRLRRPKKSHPFTTILIAIVQVCVLTREREKCDGRGLIWEARDNFFHLMNRHLLDRNVRILHVIRHGLRQSRHDRQSLVQSDAAVQQRSRQFLLSLVSGVCLQFHFAIIRYLLYILQSGKRIYVNLPDGGFRCSDGFVAEVTLNVLIKLYLYSSRYAFPTTKTGQVLDLSDSTWSEWRNMEIIPRDCGGPPSETRGLPGGTRRFLCPTYEIGEAETLQRDTYQLMRETLRIPKYSNNERLRIC